MKNLLYSIFILLVACQADTNQQLAETHTEKSQRDSLDVMINDEDGDQREIGKFMEHIMGYDTIDGTEELYFRGTVNGRAGNKGYVFSYTIGFVGRIDIYVFNDNDVMVSEYGGRFSEGNAVFEIYDDSVICSYDRIIKFTTDSLGNEIYDGEEHNLQYHIINEEGKLEEIDYQEP